MSIKLNSDLGESFGVWKLGMDETLMLYLDMANFACGFHAGDPLIMDQSIQLAVKYNILIGAHPAYPDLMGFGRRSMVCSSEEIEALVIYQCGALRAFCQANGAVLSYVKPHGGLYNDMMKDERIFKAVLKAMARYDSTLKLMVLSQVDMTKYEAIAQAFGIGLLYEVFADRAYDDEGFLVPRNQKGSILHDANLVKARLELLKKEGLLETISGKRIALKVDSLCVHGDNEEAIALVKMLRECL